MSSMNAPEGFVTVPDPDSGRAGAADPVDDRPLLGRKSVLMGMLTSGFVIANARPPSAASAATLEQPPAVAIPPVYVSMWTPSTDYLLGQQIISPDNDVVSANVAHTSSPAYPTDLANWVLSAAFVRQGPTGLLIDVTSAPFRARGDGATDDTAAIQAAVDAAASAGGGTVFFPRGTFSATRITLRSRVTLLGANWLSSVLKLRTGSNRDFIVLETVDTEQVSIRDITVNGNSSGNSSGHAISLDNTAGVYTFSDPYDLFMNVFVENAAGDAWHITSGLRESRFFNCHTKLAFGHGFSIAGTDNFFTDCTAATSGQSGWFIANGNNQFVSCKAFSNGFRCTSYALEGEGFYIQNAARNKFVACEAQDNERSGVLILGASSRHNHFTGLLVDSNAVGSRLSPPGSATAVGLVLDNCKLNVIDVVSGNQRLTQDVGIQLKNGCTGNRIRAIVGDQRSSLISASATDMSTNQLNVNGQDAIKTASVVADYTPDPHEAGTHILTVGASLTINDAIFANRFVGARLRFILHQDTTGGRVVTFNAAYLLPAFIPNTGPGKVNVVEFLYDGTHWLGVAATVGA
jgi:hypothetical protein